jgi:hypothetical protein
MGRCFDTEGGVLCIAGNHLKGFRVMCQNGIAGSLALEELNLSNCGINQSCVVKFLGPALSARTKRLKKMLFLGNPACGSTEAVESLSHAVGFLTHKEEIELKLNREKNSKVQSRYLESTSKDPVVNKTSGLSKTTLSNKPSGKAQ